jgi:transcriptional regulator with XRE-family HTH domain
MPYLFGEKLRHLRLQQDITQTDLAQRLGVARQAYVSNLEAGRKAPSLDLLLRVAGLFGVATDYMLRDTIPVAQVVDSLVVQLDQQGGSRLFGEKLRMLRLQHGLSQSDLSRQLKLTSRAYVSNLEAGRKTPSLDLVVKVADVFGVTTDQLLWDSISFEALDKAL